MASKFFLSKKNIRNILMSKMLNRFLMQYINKKPQVQLIIYIYITNFKIYN